MDNSGLKSKLVLFLAVIAVGGTVLFYQSRAAEPAPPLLVVAASPTPLPSPTATPAPVRVYITGAVAKPDVYFLPRGSIVKDGIRAAGGLTAEADLERFNQALELQDQQHIHIPRLGDTDEPPLVQDGFHPSTTPEPSRGGQINLNTATQAELDTLPRIGPALAQNIIDYREAHGGFKTIEEIKAVSGIGDSTFSQIQSLITVE